MWWLSLLGCQFAFESLTADPSETVEVGETIVVTMAWKDGGESDRIDWIMVGSAFAPLEDTSTKMEVRVGQDTRELTAIAVGTSTLEVEDENEDDKLTMDLHVIAAETEDTDETDVPDTDVPDTDAPAWTLTTSLVNVGVVFSYPQGVSCESVSFDPRNPTVCAAEMTEGPVVLTAVPDDDFGFTTAAFVGCDTVNGLNCTVDLQADRTVEVVFGD